MQASHCPCWDVPPWLVLNFLAFVRSLYCSLWCVFERLNDLDLLAYALFLAPLHRSQVFPPEKLKKMLIHFLVQSLLSVLVCYLLYICLLAWRYSSRLHLGNVEGAAVIGTCRHGIRSWFRGCLIWIFFLLCFLLAEHAFSISFNRNQLWEAKIMSKNCITISSI